MTEIPAEVISFIAGFEGGQSSDGLYRAYWDSYGNVWTIGIGETEGVHQGMVWTKAQAYADLETRLRREYAPAIDQLGVPLNDNQRSALLSFVWNLGPGSMQWDVGRYVKAREFQKAADAMLQYDHAGGVVLAGLVRRRQAERALFLKPVPKPVDPHHYDRYSTESVKLPNGVRIQERATVEEYDRLYPNRPARLKVLRAHMRLLQQHIAYRATHDAPADWSKDWRQWRWRRMSDRQTGPVHLV